MDHFNATIKDGKLVKTRRGMQISRQKFNGLSFVNTCPQDTTTTPPNPPSASDRPKPLQSQIQFVEEDGGGSRTGSFESRREGSDSPGHFEMAQGSKRRRRGTRKEHSTTASPAEAPSQPSTPLSQGGPSQPQRTLEGHTGSNVDSPLSALTHDTFLCPSEWDRALLERYLDHMALGSYPHEDILTYNPARGDGFSTMIRGDEAALHCTRMCGSILDAVLNFEPSSKCIAYYISNLCAILNQRLDEKRTTDVVTLHCIAVLAWMGVRTSCNP